MSTKKTELDAHEIYAYINQHRLSMAHHWIAVQNSLAQRLLYRYTNLDVIFLRRLLLKEILYGGVK
jgi:hypothetical protein